MRHMYVVEAKPDRSKIDAIDSRTLIYMDSEMWFEPYIDTYDRQGHLFRAHIYWLANRDREKRHCKQRERMAYHEPVA